MKLKGRIIKISLVLFVLGGIAVASVLWQSKSPDGKGLSDLGMLLTKPAFAQDTGVNFLEQEAGISAWMNAGKSIDLAKAKTAFKTIEKDTNEYINGSITLPGYKETEDIHAFVHKDGWIVAYYMKSDPASKIFDWNSYNIDNKIKGTKLDNGIVAICTAVSVAAKDVKYYDFRNPDANKIMIISANVVANDYIGKNVKTVRIKLPMEFVFYERSYLHNNHRYISDLYLDGEILSHLSSSDSYRYDILSPAQLLPDIFHSVGMDVSLFAIVVIYKES